MCLIFISLRNNPTYKLIVAANRDEFYNRKTAPAHFWEDHPGVLGGRDLEASGTWLGVNRNGRISMITNYRDLKNIKPQAPSRGKLVSEYLLRQGGPDEYLQGVAAEAPNYNGFNLIVGDTDALFYYSNYKNSIEPLSAGLHGLSNHLLNTPWPKVKKGLQKFQPLLNDTVVNPDHLLDALYDAEVAVDAELPDTGIGLERERLLSSMFIKSPGYGSRSSTVVMVDNLNNVQFVERTYSLPSFEYTTRSFEFTIRH